jgi:hypothetical protein
MSVFYWHTCRVLLLDYMSLLHWAMCRIFIGPCRPFLFDHVSRCCPSMFCFFIRPCGLTTFFHVSDFYWPTCRALAISHAMHWFVHVSHFYLITWPIQVTCSTSFNQKKIWDHHYCTDWRHNYSINVYIIIQHSNQIQQIIVHTSATSH